LSDDEDGQRLQRLADREDLRDLVLRYCLALDDRDWGALQGLFAAHARFAGGQGPQEILARLREGREAHGRTIHAPTGQLVQFQSPTNASGVVFTLGLLNAGGKTTATAMRYEDAYVREDGRWLFARRRVHTQFALPWADMAQAMTDAFPVRWPGTSPAPAAVFRVEA
jgi:hypothetical protein